MTSYAKFHKIRWHGGVTAIWWNVYLTYFLYFRGSDLATASTGLSAFWITQCVKMNAIAYSVRNKDKINVAINN